MEPINDFLTVMKNQKPVNGIQYPRVHLQGVSYVLYLMLKHHGEGEMLDPHL